MKVGTVAMVDVDQYADVTGCVGVGCIVTRQRASGQIAIVDA